jgi:catechol 2,3-dioxygenase-like lactoylglutathione lyase family enzyme
MTASSPSAAIGCIDHVVIVVDDLEAGADIYRRLGFTLSPKGVHSAAMGSANHTIMLQNDYFELLAVLAPTERNARWRQALTDGGGVAGVALTTQDAKAAHAHWLSQGLAPKEPIHFARDVLRADGARLEARFEVVSLPEVSDTGLRIFVCSQPTREAVWLPELMGHANTARAISRVTIACADPASSARQWQRVIPGVTVSEMRDGLSLTTGLHRIDLVRHDIARRHFDISFGAGQARAAGLDFQVSDLDACRTTLTSNGVTFAEKDGLIVISADAACQVRIVFEQR